MRIADAASTVADLIREGKWAELRALATTELLERSLAVFRLRKFAS